MKGRCCHSLETDLSADAFLSHPLAATRLPRFAKAPIKNSKMTNNLAELVRRL
jgi:hypothetical protein